MFRLLVVSSLSLVGVACGCHDLPGLTALEMAKRDADDAGFLVALAADAVDGDADLCDLSPSGCEFCASREGEIVTIELADICTSAASATFDTYLVDATTLEGTVEADGSMTLVGGRTGSASPDVSRHSMGCEHDVSGPLRMEVVAGEPVTWAFDIVYSALGDAGATAALTGEAAGTTGVELVWRESGETCTYDAFDFTGIWWGAEGEVCQPWRW